MFSIFSDRSTHLNWRGKAVNEEDNRKEEESAVDDLNTTPPNPPPSAPAAAIPAPESVAKWEMPKPVFQQSSGYLPKGYAEQFAPSAEKIESPPPAASPQPGGEGDSAADFPPPAPEASARATAIEPQPEIFDPVPADEDPVIASAEVGKPKSGFLRIVLVILGLLAAGLVIILFLAGIWYFFLSSSRSRGPF